MASTNFVDGVTVILSAWLNDTNTVTYSIFGNGTNYTGNAALPGTLSVVGGIDVNGTKFSVNSTSGNVTSIGSLKSGSATGIAAGGDLTVGVLLYSTGMGTFGGSGAPSISAPKGSMYLRSDGNTTNNRGYIATDSVGGWTAIITAG